MVFKALKRVPSEKYKKFRISIFHTDRLTINDNNVSQVIVLFFFFSRIFSEQIILLILLNKIYRSNNDLIYYTLLDRIDLLPRITLFDHVS